MDTPCSTLRTSALHFAARGWHVFPITPDAKKPPIIDRWETRASTNPDQIHRWWREIPYNVGIATGPSGLVVVDLDTRKPGQAVPSRWARLDIGSGAAVLRALAHHHGAPVTPTYAVSTPSGGWHLYYTASPGAPLRNTQAMIGWKIDTRAHGGYVIAPGCPVSPSGYELIDDRDPVELPDWLHHALIPKPPTAHSAPATAATTNPTGYILAALRGEGQRVRTAPPGQHNAMLCRAAYALGQLVGAGLLTQNTAQAELTTAADVLISADCGCTPPRNRPRHHRRTHSRGTQSPPHHPPYQQPESRMIDKKAPSVTTNPNPAVADGAALLDAVREALTRYVVLPTPHAADAVTLWIAATHAQPAWAHAPRLVIRGPEKRCGKSRLLDAVEALCRDPFITVNSSSAAVYRSISDDPPTMLVDEADTIFGPKADGNEDLRGLLNAGHQRNRPAKRYDAATNRVESIPTFAMAALAGIGAMPDTIEDRAVVIRMRRRAPSERVAPYRHRRDRPPLRQLAEQLTAWLRADLAVLERAEPDMPVEDRAADTWEPLVAVADHAGAHWPDRSRAAVLVLTAEATDTGEVSTRIRLLMDCRSAFGDHDAIPTAVLLERLKSDREAPWADFGPTGLTAMRLGVLLREYDIRSATIRFPGLGQAKGYQRADFTDAWTRYCPQTKPDDPSQQGQASHPYQPHHPSSARYGSAEWYGSRRTTQPSRTSLTSQNESGTAGTTKPPLRIVGGTE